MVVVCLLGEVSEWLAVGLYLVGCFWLPLGGAGGSAFCLCAMGGVVLLFRLGFFVLPLFVPALCQLSWRSFGSCFGVCAILWWLFWFIHWGGSVVGAVAALFGLWVWC